MKKLFFLATFISFFAVAGMNAQSTDQTGEPQISVKVDGLSCPFCAYGLEKKFKEIDGASDIEIDIKKGLLTFRMEDGKTIAEDKIKDKVKQAGFTPKEVVFLNKIEEQQNEKKGDGKS